MIRENGHTPAPSMLEAFSRDPQSVGQRVLRYHRLAAAALEARRNDHVYFREFLQAPSDSLAEDDRARAVATSFLIQLADDLQHASRERQELIAERMTAVSRELYGEPRMQEVERIASQEYRYFAMLRGDAAVNQDLLTRIIAYYEPAVTYEERPPIGEEYKDLAKEWGDVLQERHPKALNYLKEVAATKPRFSPPEVVEIFRHALKLESEDEELYSGVAVTESNGTSMAYDRVRNVVTVGGNTPYIPAGRLAVLYAHEVLGHATRNLNGRKFDDPLLKKGLPNNLIAEEGVTTLNSLALGGDIPVSALDHYFNIALALGMVNGRQVPRLELHAFQSARDIVRAEAQGEAVDYEAASDKAWSIANRVYRGSPGNEVVAVNTKDICYYEGLLRIGEFVKGRAGAGMPMADIMDFLMMARFDPTDDRHVGYLRSAMHPQTRGHADFALPGHDLSHMGDKTAARISAVSSALQLR